MVFVPVLRHRFSGRTPTHPDWGRVGERRGQVFDFAVGWEAWGGSVRGEGWGRGWRSSGGRAESGSRNSSCGGAVSKRAGRGSNSPSNSIVNPGGSGNAAIGGGINWVCLAEGRSGWRS